MTLIEPRRYAVHSCAWKHEKSLISVDHDIAIVQATSSAEAEGLTHQTIRTIWPASDGWNGHFVHSKLIEDPWPKGSSQV